MKKLALIIGSVFTFCVFTGLLLLAMFTNTYGINVDHSGLFPKLEISVTDQKLNMNDYSTRWENYFTDDTVYKIVNKTGHNIVINQYGNQYLNYDGNFDFMIYTSGSLIKVNGTNIILNPIPDDYQYYFTAGNLLSTQDTVVNLNVEEYVSSDQVDDDNQLNYEYVNNETTIKDGESYEIKLS